MKKLIQVICTLLFTVLALLPVAQADEVTYYIPDAQGSPVAAMDEGGTILWRKHYQPFGGELDAQAANNRVGYTGHVKDNLTGLNYMGARYYDPSIGRFMSMDPAAVNPEDPRSFNRYNYANNNPYRFVDPDGKNAALAACAAGPAGCALGVAITVYAGIKAIQGTWIALNGAKDSPTETTDKDTDEWIYGPKDDPKINDDGSTRPNTWTTPDDYSSQGEAQDKLDPFKPLDGRRSAKIPAGTDVKKGSTPGGEGPYKGKGGGNETLIPNGLPPGSVGPWEPF